MKKGKDGILATLYGSAIINRKHGAGEKLKYYRIQDVILFKGSTKWIDAEDLLYESKFRDEGITIYFMYYIFSSTIETLILIFIYS